MKDDMRSTTSLSGGTGVTDTGGFHLVPGAAVDNGRFDIMATRAMRPIPRMTYSLDVVRGRHYPRPETVHFGEDPGNNGLGVAGVRRLEVRTRRPTYVHLHGEPVGFTPVRFELVPGALTVLAPEAVP
jgi:diacylglycerol kinase family enzyme